MDLGGKLIQFVSDKAYDLKQLKQNTKSTYHLGLAVTITLAVSYNGIWEKLIRFLSEKEYDLNPLSPRVRIQALLWLKGNSN